MLIAFLIGTLIPITALALVVRHEMTSRLTAQSQRRVDALAGVIEADLAHRRDTVRAALAQVRSAIAEDNRFWRAAVDSVSSERPYLFDYAGNAMRLAGLSMLQIQEENGRIISSGHVRTDYARLEPELPRFLRRAPGGSALVRVQTPGEDLLVLAAADSVVVGSRRLDLVGGLEASVEAPGRSAGDALHVELILPGDFTDTAAPTQTTLRALPVYFMDLASGTTGLATVLITHDLSELNNLRRSIDRWFVVALALTALLVVIMASWIASRISRPVVELAEKTARVDLDRLDVDFGTARTDEIGALANGLGAMTTRLRESTAQLKDAERRATMGELARQVNHDLKNGLTPIRNVFRHLVQHAQADPAQLSGVLRERQATIEESISYLENLAANYARLSQRGTRQLCDLNDIVRVVAGGVQGIAAVETQLRDGAAVEADPLSLRRIVENLVDNAIDSLNGKGGSVTISTEASAGRVRLVVADTGAGMSEAQRARIFDDFYTTKPDGSGLGLSIVRRLVMDLDGTVVAESEVGRGSRFIVDLPAASVARAGGADGGNRRQDPRERARTGD